MTTESKLNLLLTTKQNIKSAIEEKGQTVGDIPFAQYADKIEAIKVGVDVKDGLIYTDASKTEATLYTSDGVIPDFMINILTDRYYGERLKLNIKNPVTAVGSYSLIGVELNKPFFSVNNIQSIGEKSFLNSSFPNDDLVVKANWSSAEKMFSMTTFKSISFDNDVTKIAKELFSGANIIENISELQLPPNLTILGDNAFSGLSTPGTFEVILPDSVEEISFSPFEYSKVKKITAGPNIVKDAYGDSNKYTNFAYLSELLEAKIASGLSYKRTFYYCKKLQTCEIGSLGNPVTSISNDTFEDCSSLIKLIVYCTNPSSPPSGAPWGATNPELKIEYRQA